jgi:TonB-linked SusC/RagA family outer membrane protein
MRLTAFCLLAGLMHVHATGISQTVSFSGKDVPLPKVFEAIERQTGYVFFYNASLLKDVKPVTLHLVHVSLEEALKASLKDQPLDYGIENKTVVITKRQASPPPDAVPSSQPDATTPPGEIRGHVADTAGNPLEGATVKVKGTSIMASTDARGNFRFESPGDSVTLIISFVGYTSREILWRKAYPSMALVTLRHSDNPLDATEVVAYGTNTRRFSIGSVSVLTADDIAQQPVTNLAQAMEGRIPGLLVTPTGGGIPGATVLLQVRGQNTVQSSTGSPLIYSQPLIIVDGIPTATQNNNQVQLLNSFIAGSGLSPINSLNPADIESISVLKDADATSIYGSQGANGVIVITTKKGRAGKTAFNLNVNTGPNAPIENLHMLNTQQYLQLREEALQLDGLTLSDPFAASQLPDLLNFDTTQYTNWVRKFFNRDPLTTNVHASLSGGSADNSYILSGGYTRTPYNLPGNFADNRLTLHDGEHHISTNRRFTMDFGADLSYDKNNSSVSGGMAGAMTTPPDAPNMFTPSGALAWNYDGVPIPQLFATLEQPYYAQTFNLNASVNMNYEVIKGLKIGVLAGYSRSDLREYSAMPLGSQDPAYYPYSTADFVSGVSQTIDIEPQLNYRKVMSNGILTVLVGGTYKKNSSYSNQLDGSNYPDDALLNSIEGAQSVTYTDNSSIYKYVGGFGRLNYVYASKYIVNLTGRTDGSSNFGPSHQFGSFGSAGLGWIFSEEKGFRRSLPFISYGKLSGDYGTNGTDGIAPYNYQAFWKITSGGFFGNPLFQGTVPYAPVNLYNPDYTWASKHALNLSLDLGFLKDRLLLNGTWYQNRTSNQLTSYPLPSQTGFTSVVENMNATVQNRGVEFTVSTKNIRHKNFSWNTTFNISANRNKLLAFPNLANSPFANTYTIGKPVSTLYGFKFAGINDTTGIFQFYKGDGKTISQTRLSYGFASQGGDLVPIGPGEPDFYGGLGNSFTYKGLSVNIFFQFSKAYSQNYLSALYNAGGGPGTENNLPNFVLGKMWLSPGDNHAVLQRPTTGAFSPNASPLAAEAQQASVYFSASTGGYSNDFYMRLKTLSISYQMPGAWVKTLDMTSANVFVNVQNVLTFTNYKFGDPQLPGQLYGLPTQRVVAAGLSLNF